MYPARYVLPQAQGLDISLFTQEAFNVEDLARDTGLFEVYIALG